MKIKNQNPKILIDTDSKLHDEIHLENIAKGQLFYSLNLCGKKLLKLPKKVKVDHNHGLVQVL